MIPLHIPVIELSDHARMELAVEPFSNRLCVGSWVYYYGGGSKPEDLGEGTVKLMFDFAMAHCGLTEDPYNV